MDRSSELDRENGQAALETRLRGLFGSALAGDAAAYRAFLAELGARLRGYFRKRLFGFPDDVEDLVQETLLAIHNQRHTWDAREPLTPWAHAIARYKLVDFLRRESRSPGVDAPLDEEALFSAVDTEAAEARRDLGKLLAELPDKQRAPIVHMKLEGLSVAETARLTGQSESAVKVSVHRGLKALAAKIRGRK